MSPDALTHRARADRLTLRGGSRAGRAPESPAVCLRPRGPCRAQRSAAGHCSGSGATEIRSARVLAGNGRAPPMGTRFLDVHGVDHPARGRPEAQVSMACAIELPESPPKETGVNVSMQRGEIGKRHVDLGASVARRSVEDALARC